MQHLIKSMKNHHNTTASKTHKHPWHLSHFTIHQSKMHPCLALVLTFTLLLTICMPAQISSAAAKAPWIVLSSYSRTMKIGQEFRLLAITSDLSRPSFSSSSRSIATVDTYGLITAKKTGSCKISAKSGKSIAYCKITISKTTITLNKKSVTLEHGAAFRLTAKTSNGSTPTFKTNKKSVATVNDKGTITAVKPGEAMITVKADQTEVYCNVKVKQPNITLSANECSLTVGQTKKLTAKVSSGLKPTWSSSKSSVASVDQNGKITAVKAGTALIKAKLDGVTATCVVTVKK